jgi:ribosomal protein S27E
MKSDSELHSNLCELCPIYGQTGSDHCFEDALQYVIKVLEQEPCEDCISRKKAKQFLYEKLDRLNDNELYDIFSRIIDDMYNELPSVTPQPKMGRWIRVDKDKLKCSECEVIHYIAQYPQSANINYCPNCGTKMVEPQERSGKE